MRNNYILRICAIMLKTLETESLILRQLSNDDFDAVHSYASVTENILYMPWGPNSEADTREFIDRAISASLIFSSGKCRVQSVVLPENNG